MTQDIENIRTRLVKLMLTVTSDTLRDMSIVTNEERMKYVIFVSSEDSCEASIGINEGLFGDIIQSEGCRKGLLAIFPLLFGHTVIWNSPKTEIRHLRDLNQLELLAVIDNQKLKIKELYEQRQKL